EHQKGAVGYNVSAFYTSAGFSGASRITDSALGFSVFPASGISFSSDYEWWAPLPTTDTDNTRTFGFYIIYSYTSGDHTGDYDVGVTGTLAPETLTVSGPALACSITTGLDEPLPEEIGRRPVPGPRLSYPNGNPVIDPNTGQAYPVPPGMDIEANAALANNVY